MIKLAINLVKIVLTISFALLFGSCGMDINSKSITGSGNVTTTIRNVEKFDKIQVSKGLECEVEIGTNQKVQVIADDNLVNGITTQVENGILVISSEYNRYKNVKSKKIKVTIPTISGLETSSGSRLVSTSILRGKSIFIKSSSGSSIDAILEFDEIIAQSTSGSAQSLSGLALDLQTESSSGSTINAKNLKANAVSAQSSSGSTNTVYPIESLQAKASSGSSVIFKNTPKTITKVASSGGNVSKD